MFYRRIFPVLFFLAAQTAFSQIAETKKPAEDATELKKEAVQFLRETMADVNNLRTLENRISFASEMAGLMWFHDEREARAMFQSVVADFKELLMQFDSQMNALPPSEEGEDYNYGGPFFGGEPSDRARLTRKFSTAMSVRQQIVMSIAEHDAELAFGFYYDSLQAVSNTEFRKQMETQDTYFEFQLMTQIAETNAGKAAEFGKKSLGKGFTFQHVELLKKIYAKDADKGVEFAGDILSRLKSEKIDSSDFYVLSSLLAFGRESYENSVKPGGRKAVYSQQDLRDLADIFAQAILNSDGDAFAGQAFIDEIEKFAPSRAMQIRAKMRKRPSNTNSYYGSNSSFSSGNANRMMNANTSTAAEKRSKEMAEKEEAEKKLMEDVQKLGDKELPKEEREKIIGQARKIIAATPGKDKKIMALSALAAQVAKMGDKELAAEIMKDAENLVDPQPKNYQDFMFTWLLAAGYAEANPAKAFPLLEDTIYRLNDTISAFVKAAEFFDVNGEIIQDGEVQVGVFGGSMVRGLTKELGVADNTIRSLANADFGKTRALTNRFDRTEVRILAKMLILRAVLGDKKEAAKTEIEIQNSPPF